MYELPIVSLLARDRVEGQFAAADRRGPARDRTARRDATPTTAPRAPLRTATATALRAIADRVEPRREARPRSA